MSDLSHPSSTVLDLRLFSQVDVSPAEGHQTGEYSLEFTDSIWIS